MDALLVHSQVNRFYLSGFWGSEGYLWVRSGEGGWLFVDFRYEEKAKRTIVEGYEVKSTRFSAELFEQVMEAIREEKPTAVGFEEHLVTVSEWEKWKKAFPQITWMGLREKVEGMRMVKEQEEIEKIQRACKVVEETMHWIVCELKEGIAEIELARELEYQLKKRGAQRAAFEPIVIFGSNTEMPHGAPSERELKNGDPITIDLGAVVDGYHSDVTRSFVFGKADEEYARCWKWVQEAKTRAQDAAKQGILGKELDMVARDFLMAKGVGEAFAHGLGHGVGLEIHEKPFLNVRSEEILAPGMVITIEPGVYFPGKWGIRMEDTYLVESRWASNLSESIPQFMEF